MFDPITTLTQPFSSDPVHYFLALKDLSDFIWLDSGRPFGTQGRFDIFCAEAATQITLDSTGQHWLHKNNGCTAISEQAFEEWISSNSAPANNYDPSLKEALQALPFIGGIVGFTAYAWRNTDFGISTPYRYTGDIAHFYSFEWALVIDHHSQSATLVGASKAITKIAQHLANAKRSPTGRFACSSFEPDIAAENYLAAIHDIHEYILAGDCYQVNFAQRFHAKFQGDLDSAYLRLREATPSPFSAYFKNTKNPILSLSPERFLAFEGASVLTQPIKGSSARGATPEEDAALAEALINSEKNRAENVMIVDLLRNDLSQCCKPFSVKVPRIFELQTFANVHHLVSTVIGELEENITAFDLFKRSFPGGSITGAPKKRAMEIIDELETEDRGAYCGSIVYFSRNGKADSSITIRTLQAEGGSLYCWGGGGIVLDSNAHQEYEESLFKVQKLMRALSSP